MNVLAIALLTTMLAAAPAPAGGNNPMLQELLEKGVAISDGSTVRLNPPFMPQGLDAAGQRAVIDKLAGPNHSFADLARQSLQAPVVINIRSIPTKSEGFVRVIDAGFLAYGDWGRFRSNEFLEGLLRSAQQEKEGGQGRSGLVPEAELAKRNIQPQAGPGLEEHYFFSRVNLLDRVEVASTRRSIGSRGEDWMILAAKIDPRFVNDPKYPDQWRPLEESSSGDLVPGKATPYTASGFYVKAVRLADPAGAVFIEYHMVFEEPHGWFRGGQQLRSKLPLLIQDEVRSLRRRLSLPAAGARQ